jgi:hypothetical protein
MYWRYVLWLIAASIVMPLVFWILYLPGFAVVVLATKLIEEPTICPLHQLFPLSPFTRFLRDLYTGVGFPIHIYNILITVMQEAGGLAWPVSPKAWRAAWKVMQDTELIARTRDILDPTMQLLSRQGSLPGPDMIAPLRNYWGGNVNPAAVLNRGNNYGHKVLFDPNSTCLRGKISGGFDTRARVYIADARLDRYPEKNAREIAVHIDNALGQYNEINRAKPSLIRPGLWMWQVFLLGCWTLISADVARRVSSAPGVTHPWLYYVTGFFFFLLPLLYMSPYSVVRSGTGIAVLGMVGLFICFSVWPSFLSPFRPLLDRLPPKTQGEKANVLRQPSPEADSSLRRVAQTCGSLHVCDRTDA